MGTTQFAAVYGAIQGVPIEIILEWDPSDPCAVALGFSEDAQWLVARDLLAEGMTTLLAPVGEGDIRIWAQFIGGELLPLALMHLSSPDGQAYVEIDRKETILFLDRTYQIVGKGRETIPDGEYEKLLDGAT